MKSSLSSPAFIFILLITAVSLVFTSIIQVTTHIFKWAILAAGYGTTMPNETKITVLVAATTLSIAELSWLSYIA